MMDFGRLREFCFLLVLLHVVSLASASQHQAQENRPCDIQQDILLAQLPNGNNRAYLKCHATGVRNNGFWQRKSCPSGQFFDFTNQRCANALTRQRDTLPRLRQTKFAVLNQSCSRGENCLGNTVCDLRTMRCLCPIGTVPRLETLSCVVRSNGNDRPRPRIRPVDRPPTRPQPRPIARPPPRPTVPRPRHTAAPGSSCLRGERCGGNSVCNPLIGVCSCPEDTHDIGGVCVVTKKEPVELGDVCDRLTTCPVDATCTNGQCRCKRPLIQQGTVCVTIDQAIKSMPGDSCSQGQLCTGNSLCNKETKICSCKSGYRLTDQQCRSEKTIVVEQVGGVGSPCSLNTNCMIGAYCNSNSKPPRCQCLSTHVDVNEMCHKVVYPGEDGCDYDDQCSAAYDGAVCNGRVCECPLGTKVSVRTCIPIIAYPGDACFTNGTVTCSGGSLCMDSVCVCPSGLVLFQRQCLFPKSLVKAIGSKCTSEDRCAGATQCIAGTCRCALGLQRRGSVCAATLRRKQGAVGTVIVAGQKDDVGVDSGRRTRLGFYCKPRQRVCAQGNGTCVNGYCQCPEKYIAIRGRCRLLNVPLGYRCNIELGQICESNSACIGGVCKSYLLSAEARDRKQQRVPSRLRFLQKTPKRCFTDQQCSQIDKAICSNGACTCPDGFQLVGKQCRTEVQFVPIGGRCSAFEDCDGGAECINGFCQCTDGSQDRGGVCEQYPGGRCSSGQVCTGGASCQFGVCRCPDGREPVQNRCHTSTAKPGDTCQNGEDCTGGSRCIFGTCLCPGGEEIINGVCRDNQVANPGDDCSRGQVCQGGSYCNPSRVCSCPIGEIVVNNRCTGETTRPGEVNPGESCRNGEQCLGGSTCINFICVCMPPLQPVSGQCINLAVVAPGRSCANGERCSGTSSCLRSICRCKSGQTIDPVSNSCRPASNGIMPGLACIPGSRAECIGESFCMNAFCSCLQGQAIRNNECSIGGDSKVAEPGASCTRGETCIGGSYCYNNQICRCPTGQQIVGSRCEVVSGIQKRPGEQCSPGEVCVGRSDCIGNICRCSEGYLIANFNCVKKEAEPGSPCVLSQLCQGGSTCLGGRCECPANYVVIERQCRILNVPPGHSCTSMQRCSGGSSCVAGVCTCLAGQSIGGVCQTGQSSGAAPGQTCNSQIRCTGGSFCNNALGKCECHVGQTVANGQCITGSAALPGQPCGTNRRCVDSSDCISGYCRCRQGYTLVGNRCVLVPTAQPGGSCAQNEVCLGGSTCISGRCTCPSGQNPVNNICKLSLTSKPGQTCSAGQICVGNSYCAGDKICRCPGGQLAISGICLNSALARMPGQSCADGGICVGGSLCDSRRAVCTCPAGTIQQNQQCEVTQTNGGTAPPGAPCRQDQRCTGGSSCQDNLCLCPFGFIIIQQTCVRPNAPAALPGQLCPGSTRCLGGSFCIQSRCVCPAGSSIVDDSCKEGVVPGASCSAGQKCTGGSFCNNGVCTCPSTQLIQNNACVAANNEPAAPGSPCSAITQCAHNSFCNNQHICQCYNGYIKAGKLCLNQELVRPPGARCTAQIICSGGSNCAADICTCPRAQVIMGETCVDTKGGRRPGETCNQQQFCAGESFCEGGVCVCRAERIEYNGGCVKGAVPAQSCNAGEICVGGSTCNGQLCICPSGTIAANDICYPTDSVSYPGGSCFAGQQCVGNAVCRFSACVCPPGTNVHAGVCQLPVSDVKSGGACSYSYQCVTGLTCMFGVCRCTNGATNCPGGGEMSSPPGGPCTAGQRCLGGSRCRDGWCVCPQPNMVVTDGVCLINDGFASLGNRPRTRERVVKAEKIVERAELGETCGENRKCSGGSICVAGECICRRGSSIVGNECVKDPAPVAKERVPLSSPPRGSCARGEICRGGSVCDTKRRRCICPPTKPIAAGAFCIAQPKKVVVAKTTERPKLKERVLPGEACDHQTVCTGGSICNAAALRCECPIGAKPLDGICSTDRVGTSVKPKAECSSQLDCDEERICVGGKCVCKPGRKERRGECVNIKRPRTAPPATSANNNRRTSTSTNARSSTSVKRDRKKPKADGDAERKPRKPRPRLRIRPAMRKIKRRRKEKCPNRGRPVREDGKALTCSGMTPNCPPRSYCYVTGVASEGRYFCCGS